MAFNRVFLPRQELDVHTYPSGHRVYKTPIGELDSVTSVLAMALDNSKVDDWKNRVGEAEVNQVMSQARNHGNAVHGLMEAYLAGEKVERSSVMPTNKHVFLSIKPYLDKYITDIYGIELPLYSAHLHTAGRADVAAKWHGRNAIIDFKTSRRAFKDSKDERLVKYNLQATAYAMMMEERYGITVDRNVIITQAMHNQPMIIVKDNHKYRNLVERLFIHQWNRKSKRKELV